MLLLIAASLRDGTRRPNRQRLINDGCGTLHRLLACAQNLKKSTASTKRHGGTSESEAYVTLCNLRYSPAVVLLLYFTSLTDMKEKLYFIIQKQCTCYYNFVVYKTK